MVGNALKDIAGIKEFRRKQGYLEWHFMPDCHRWPEHHYISDRPEGSFPVNMLCRTCLNLYKATLEEEKRG